MKIRLAITLILSVMMASAVAAQFGRQFRGLGSRGGYAVGIDIVLYAMTH